MPLECFPKIVLVITRSFQWFSGDAKRSRGRDDRYAVRIPTNEFPLSKRGTLIGRKPTQSTMHFLSGDVAYCCRLSTVAESPAKRKAAVVVRGNELCVAEMRHDLLGMVVRQNANLSFDHAQSLSLILPSACVPFNKGSEELLILPACAEVRPLARNAPTDKRSHILLIVGSVPRNANTFQVMHDGSALDICPYGGEHRCRLRRASPSRQLGQIRSVLLLVARRDVF